MTGWFRTDRKDLLQYDKGLRDGRNVLPLRPVVNKNSLLMTTTENDSPPHGSLPRLPRYVSNTRLPSTNPFSDLTWFEYIPKQLRSRTPTSERVIYRPVNANYSYCADRASKHCRSWHDPIPVNPESFGLGILEWQKAGGNGDRTQQRTNSWCKWWF